MMPTVTSRPSYPSASVRQSPDDHQPAPELAAKNNDPHAAEAALKYPSASARQPRDDLQRALALAVKNNDLRAAEDILKQGCDPDQLQSRCDSESMRELLTFARRRNLLYPAGASRDHDTDLDQALQGWQRDLAKTLLTNKTAGKTIGEAWRDAVAQGEVDVQRAILMLEADKDRSFRVLEAGPNTSKKSFNPLDIFKRTSKKDRPFPAQEGGRVKDPDVIKVLKEIPHYSPKRGTPQDFNCKVQGMMCRRFAADQLERQAADPFIKSDYRKYQSLNKIASLDKDGLETKFQNITAHATNTYLVNSQKFGQFLADQFTAMENDRETTRLMLLLIPRHAMSAGLRIKEENGSKVYVAKFFDPNRTTSHARSASGALKTFEFQDMRSYLDSSLKTMYAHSNVPVTAYIHPGKKDQSGLPIHTSADKTLTARYIEDHEIDAVALHCLMSGGFAADVKRLANVMSDRSEAERLMLLAAKDEEGTPGLNLALQRGHADTVKAFGELLETVPQNDRAILVAAKDARKIPGLYFALQNGHSDTVKAFGALLQQIPVDQRAELVAAERTGGDCIPGLYVALEFGHAEAVKAFGELLQLVPEDQRVRLLTARRDADRAPGLNKALENGHAEAVKAFGELLQLVPEDQRADLLAAERADGIPGLQLARKKSHTEAVKAFEELLQLVPEDQRAKLWAAKKS